MKSISCSEYERIRKSFKCSKCHETIWLTEIVNPCNAFASIDRSTMNATKSSEHSDHSNTADSDIRLMLLPGAINTIVGIVGLVYGSPWALALLPGIPLLIVSLWEYKGWVAKIALVTAYIILALSTVLFLIILLQLLPIFAMLVVYLLLVNLVLFVPFTGEFWSPGKHGGYTSAPKALVWGIRICLALTGLIILFVWLLFG